MGKHLSKYSSEADYNNNKDNHVKPYISLITTSPKKMKYEKKVLTNLITFYIDNTQYQAEEGMTWEEWVNSEYNTDGFYISDQKTYKGDMWIYLRGEPYTVILNNAKYALYLDGHGGAGN